MSASFKMMWQSQTLKAPQDFWSHLKSYEKELGKKLGVQLSCYFKKDYFLFELEGVDEKENSHKFLKKLQKELVSISSSFRTENITDRLEEEENWLVITPSGNDGPNRRIQKLMHHIRDTYYYDVNHLCGPEPEILGFYLLKRKMMIIDWQGKTFLLDEAALKKKINLNCSACTQTHQFGCCCGSPCHYSHKNLEGYKNHEKAIIQALKRIEPDFYEAILKQTACEQHEEDLELVNFAGGIGECEGRCMLLVREEGMGKCLAHQYALEHQLPVYEIAPLSCLLFPFEIIVCETSKGGKYYYLTSVVEETIASQVGRWGSYETLNVSLACIREALCNETFKKEDYQPVYKVNQQLMTYSFGDFLYKGVAQALES